MTDGTTRRWGSARDTAGLGGRRLPRCCPEDDRGRGRDGGLALMTSEAPPGVEAPGAPAEGPRLVPGTVLAALLGSACCTLPLLLAAVGIGLTSAGAGFLRRAPLVGASLMALMILSDVARRNGGRLDLPAIRRNRGRILAASTAFLLTWAAVTYVAAPLLGRVLAGRSASVPGRAFVVPPGDRRLELRIDGMYCPACIWTVRSRLSGLPGVSDVAVSFGAATVAYDPTVISPEQIERAATFYVYRARIVGPTGG